MHPKRRLVPMAMRVRLLTAVFVALLVGTAFGSYIYLGGAAGDRARNALVKQQTQRQTDQARSLGQHVSSDIAIIIKTLQLA
ncbi:MAG: hypothetical protein C4292_01470, partial [Nitrososphaera sp.]